MMSGNYGSNLSGFLGGLFGDSGSPYEAAGDQYQKYMSQAQNAQNPFFNAGKGSIPQFQQWLQGMQNPSGFINNLMGQYKESPWAQFSQQQGVRQAQNLGSATGLTGSTPLQMQAQQNAQNISSQDMQSWLQNVLGVNNQYGAGQAGIMGMGANAANSLTNMYGNMGQQMGDVAFGQRAGQNQDQSNMWGGLLQMLMHGIGS